MFQEDNDHEKTLVFSLGVIRDSDGHLLTLQRSINLFKGAYETSKKRYIHSGNAVTS